VARRETVGMVCQTCGTDYAPAEPTEDQRQAALDPRPYGQTAHDLWQEARFTPKGSGPIAYALANAEARGEARGRAEAERLRARVEGLANDLARPSTTEHPVWAAARRYYDGKLRAVLADTEGGQA
jgi:hypothetical protein